MKSKIKSSAIPNTSFVRWRTHRLGSAMIPILLVAICLVWKNGGFKREGSNRTENQNSIHKSSKVINAPNTKGQIKAQQNEPPSEKHNYLQYDNLFW